MVSTRTSLVSPRWTCDQAHGLCGIYRWRFGSASALPMESSRRRAAHRGRERGESMTTKQRWWRWPAAPMVAGGGYGGGRWRSRVSGRGACGLECPRPASPCPKPSRGAIRVPTRTPSLLSKPRGSLSSSRNSPSLFPNCSRGGVLHLNSTT
jgi:hypothetical protein